MRKTKKKFRLWIILRNLLLSLLTVIVIWVVFSNVMTVYEQRKYQPMGELVEVDGKNMHIYKKGEGDHTIVLLSGLGTAAPALDFEPLINDLSENHRVVLVEYFGYGWSDLSDQERTVENIVEETRTALSKSGIQEPYILMPHSISGIYSMYFVNAYPEEVEAVIGIDPTLPQVLQYFDETAPDMPMYLSYLAPAGIARAALNIDPDSFLPIAEPGSYTEENLKITKAISSWRGYNKNIINETNEINDNIHKTIDMKFPADLPVLFFTPKEDKTISKNKVTFYETQLTDSPASKIVTLEGHHYLHWTKYKEINQEVNKFIRSFDTD